MFLCLLGSMIANSQVAFASQFVDSEELVTKPATNNHGCNGCGVLQLPNSSSQVQTNITFNKNDYKNSDPYDLEELHQVLFRKGELFEAAKALVASAMRRESDNQDYLLGINPQALTYIEQNDTEQIQTLLLKVRDALALQFIHYQKPAQSVTLDGYKEYPSADTFGIATKKIGVQ